ncbi:MAG: protein nirF [Gammaproteobacteria bacterium]|nr:protein nirF [Gammaproteobacteria bacterium]
MRYLLLSALLLSTAIHARGTGDLGVLIERADSSVQIVETSNNTSLARVNGLGDLSHASIVYSRDAQFAYVFGRDGGLSKIDILSATLVARTLQSGNSIGGAISQDGRLVAVSNYKPGGVKIFDAETLELVADIPSTYGDKQQTSKVIGLVDSPGQKFVFSLWDAGEIWVLDMSDQNNPAIQKFKAIGLNPYDALITGDGRYYIAGLFGEDGMALLDLWDLDKGVKRILPNYGRGEEKLPVYKMPHLEGWAVAGNLAFVPAVGRHEVLVIDMLNWSEAARIKVHGQPIFVMARPDGRQVWVNFALPNNDTIQIIDTQRLAVVKQIKPGKGVLHMEFEPRGEEVWLSVRDEDRVEVYDTNTFERKAALPAKKPSGIFFTARAHRIGL